MAGLSAGTPIPTRIVIHQQTRRVEVEFDDGITFFLPMELMRVYSPSAEVKGHGPGQEVLQVGKRDVALNSVDAVGQYAIQPTFSDGHDTGIFSWDYLYWLGENQTELWDDYLQRLENAGASRDADAPENIKFQAPSGGACGHHH